MSLRKSSIRESDRVSGRYLTADGITELKKSSSADADSLVGSEDKVSWEVGDKEADDDSDNDFPAGSESCDSSSVTNVSLPADSKKGDGSEFYTAGAEIGHIRKSKSGRNSGKRNREYMKNLHEFLQASSPGVEI